MKTKKFFRLLTFLFLVSNLSAQETAAIKVKEIGIGIYNLNNFSLQYRWGTEKKLFRITGLIGTSTAFGKANTSSTSAGTVNATNDENKTPLYLNLGLAFSILKFKPVTEKFGFMYGPHMGLNYSYNSSDKISINSANSTTTTSRGNSNSFQPFVGIVLGAACKITNSFYIYAEISPIIYYTYTNSSTVNIYTGISYTQEDQNDSSNNTIGISNLSNSGAMLSFVYRLNK